MCVDDYFFIMASSKNFQQEHICIVYELWRLHIEVLSLKKVLSLLEL